MTDITNHFIVIEMSFRTLILLLAVAAYCDAANKMPPGITPCSRNDPDLDNCALRSAQIAIPFMAKGNPTLGLAPMDPLHVSELRIDDTGNSKQISVDVIVRKFNVYGLRNIKIKKFKVNLQTGEISWSGVIPRLELIGQYSGSGRILFMRVQGEGPMNITLENTEFTYAFRLVRRDPQGRSSEQKSFFVAPRDATMECTPANAIIYVENMFKGDRRLEEHMNRFLTENWKELNAELGPTLVEVFRRSTDQLINRITELVPFDQLFPDTSSLI